MGGESEAAWRGVLDDLVVSAQSETAIPGGAVADCVEIRFADVSEALRIIGSSC
jgi:hypothetical protein